jgi:hypothetical protein
MSTTKKSIIQKLLAVHSEGIHLFVKKNADYGDAFATYGPIGVLVRMGDKINRLLSITKNGTVQVESESMRDTLIDLFNYSTMAIMLLDEGDEEINNGSKKDARFTQFSSVNFDALDLFIQQQTNYLDECLKHSSIQLISRSADQIQEALNVTTNGITIDNNKHKMLRDVLLNLCNYAVISVMLYDDANRDASVDDSTDEQPETNLSNE